MTNSEREGEADKWAQLWTDNHRDWFNRNEAIAVHTDGIVKWILGFSVAGTFFWIVNPDKFNFFLALPSILKLLIKISITVCILAGFAFRITLYYFLLRSLNLITRKGDLTLMLVFAPQTVKHLIEEGVVKYENDAEYKEISISFNRCLAVARCFGWTTLGSFAFIMFAVGIYFFSFI